MNPAPPVTSILMLGSSRFQKERKSVPIGEYSGGPAPKVKTDEHFQGSLQAEYTVLEPPNTGQSWISSARVLSSSRTINSPPAPRPLRRPRSLLYRETPQTPRKPGG